MTEVFLSYKREDEARVSRLARALADAGFDIWWDRELPGGEDWRARIEASLDAARIVIVCWTEGSVGPNGGFVRDEASRAGARLLPVLLERVTPPLGFGGIQAFDLSHWRGNPKDPFFRDLAAAIGARLSGATTPKPTGPARRAFRRWVYGGGLTAAILAAVGFAWSMPLVRETTCAIQIGQPGLRQACCNAGFVPKQLTRAVQWTASPVRKPAYLRQSTERFETEVMAREDALSRLSRDAAQICAPPDTRFQRLNNANGVAREFDCHRADAGWTCGVTYTAQCLIEERQLVEACAQIGDGSFP